MEAVQMTDKQFDKIIKMIRMVLDGCKDLDEATLNCWSWVEYQMFTCYYLSPRGRARAGLLVYDAFFASCAAGRTTVIRVPTSGRETISNQPPWRSTIHLAMDSPRPVPPVLRSRDWSVR